MAIIEIMKERYLYILLFVAAFAVSAVILWGGWRMRFSVPRIVAMLLFLIGLSLAISTLYLLLYVILGDATV
ncbi:hypothetical protein [Brochothrix campestris]|uniref:Uncharacterized protein n=1 Tax=Brochothrix campestris FSL F6-1037 TaxID=1265861 RepID=W7CZD5_9LIST|nr:hypothetical protein [Brochothrix campestris]EUJ41126.1 hypothetical protein BCAMP_03900 [Brochothrix campestris FSL F6-1037]